MAKPPAPDHQKIIAASEARIDALFQSIPSADKDVATPQPDMHYVRVRNNFDADDPSQTTPASATDLTWRGTLRVRRPKGTPTIQISAMVRADLVERFNAFVASQEPANRGTVLDVAIDDFLKKYEPK